MAIAENRFRSPVVRYCTHDQSIGQRGQGFLAVSSQMVHLDNGYYSECTHGGRTSQAQSIHEKGQTCHTHKYLVKGGGGSKRGGRESHDGHENNSNVEVTAPAQRRGLAGLQDHFLLTCGVAASRSGGGGNTHRCFIVKSQRFLGGMFKRHTQTRIEMLLLKLSQQNNHQLRK